MKKIVGLFITILLSSFPVFAKDMRFIQVTDTYFSQYDKTTVNRLENLVNEINSEKNVEFVVFTGNNIAKPKTEDVENFVKIANKLNTPYYIVLGNKDVNKLKDLSKSQYMKIVKKNNKTHKKITTPNYVFTKNKWVFIVVDGSKDVIPTSTGYYKDDTSKFVLFFETISCLQSSTQASTALSHIANASFLN